MLSKEEILDKNVTDGTGIEVTQDEALKSMSEYAEQEAIAFVEWMGQNEFNERNRNGQANNPELTLQQLYQIYKQSKPQQP